MWRNSLNSSLIFLFLCLGFDGFSQILNIEKARLDSLEKEKKYRISFDAQFNLYNRSAGEGESAEFLSLSNDLNAVYAPKKHAYIALGNLSFTQNNGATILNNGYLHLRTNFNYRREISTELFTQIQYDKFRGLSDRYLLGGTVRWKTIEGKKFSLFLGTGPMYEYELWRRPNQEGFEEANFLKLSSYLITRWDIAENMDFNAILYYQVGHDRSIEEARHRYSLNSNINFRISSFLAFTTSISMAYEDKPLIPITRFIYQIENGLTLSF